MTCASSPTTDSSLNSVASSTSTLRHKAQRLPDLPHKIFRVLFVIDIGLSPLFFSPRKVVSVHLPTAKKMNRDLFPPFSLLFFHTLTSLAKGGSSHSPSSTRRALSTTARVAVETFPHGALLSRSLLMVRSWSQRITLFVF